MQYIELEEFESYLQSRGLVEEKYIPHYSRWVLRFLRSDYDWKNTAPRDLLQCYSDQLARDESVADWQLKQAMRAAELYLNVYLPQTDGEAGASPAVQPSGDSSPDHPPSGNSFAEALEQMRDLMRLRHYSKRTDKTYSDWVRRYFRYTKMQSLDWLKPDSIRAWLSHLATQRKVAASTQNQAFNAVLFLFRETLHIEVPDINAVRARRGPRLPVVFSTEEVQKVLSCVDGTIGLMLKLTYGAGLRVSETVRLRVQDLDFGNGIVMVRRGKGDKDRTTLLPEKLVPDLRQHLEAVKKLHEEDLAKGSGAVWLPGALARKYPKAPIEWKWQYAFPAKGLSVDKESGQTRRHHVSEQILQRAIKDAVRRAGVHKHATVHTLRHSFATHLLMAGTNIREVQELLGHKKVETTMIYTHVMRDLGDKPKSPLDAL